MNTSLVFIQLMLGVILAIKTCRSLNLQVSRPEQNWKDSNENKHFNVDNDKATLFTLIGYKLSIGACDLTIELKNKASNVKLLKLTHFFLQLKWSVALRIL